MAGGGGVGISSSITGVSVTRAVGGKGGPGWKPDFSGGATGIGDSAANNSGSGGEGSKSSSGTGGGNGGSGIVIIRYPYDGN